MVCALKLCHMIPHYGISSVNSIIDYLLSGSFHLADASPWILQLKHFLRQFVVCVLKAGLIMQDL